MSKHGVRMQMSQVALKRRAAAEADARFAAEEAAARAARNGGGAGGLRDGGLRDGQWHMANGQGSGPADAGGTGSGGAAGFATEGEGMEGLVPPPRAGLRDGKLNMENGKGSVPTAEVVVDGQRVVGEWDGAGLPGHGGPKVRKGRTRTDIYTTPYKDGRVRYTKALGREICRLIASGEPLGEICRRRGMPTRISVFEWLNTYPEFKRDYVLARRVARDGLEEEMLEIIDDRSQDVLTLLNKNGMYYKVLNPVAVQRAKARVAVRAKMIEWHMPKKHHPEADEAAAASAAAVAVAAASHNGKYVLTEERRAKMIAQRRKLILDAQAARAAEEGGEL